MRTESKIELARLAELLSASAIGSAAVAAFLMPTFIPSVGVAAIALPAWWLTTFWRDKQVALDVKSAEVPRFLRPAPTPAAPRQIVVPEDMINRHKVLVEAARAAADALTDATFHSNEAAAELGELNDYVAGLINERDALRATVELHEGTLTRIRKEFHTPQLAPPPAFLQEPMPSVAMELGDIGKQPA